MHKKHIAIIGCGYIGMAAAAIWSKKEGVYVTATTRTPARLPELSEAAQKSLVFKAGQEEDFRPILAANETLLITIAADNGDQYENAYLRTSQMIRHLALETPKRRLIYTSSTTVYGDHHGLWVDETSDLLNTTEMGKILIETEKTYLSLQEFGWEVTILRLAEIYGPGRDITGRLAQYQTQPFPGTGEAYTNMVHRDDAANAIDYALQHDLTGIYNVVDDDHPTRRELYENIAGQSGLTAPSWDPKLATLRTGSKRVSNHKLKAAGFEFVHPHRLLGV